MSRARITVIVASGVVLLLAVLTAGMLIGQRALAPAADVVEAPAEEPELPEDGPGDAPEPEVGADPPEGFVEFRDEEAGFAIFHPEGWQRGSPADPEVRLLVTADEQDSVMVRVTPLDLGGLNGEDITEEELQELHAFTEELVRAGEDVEVLVGPEMVEVADTVGTYYLYTFEDEESGEQGAHARYFVFTEGRMVTLLFQTIPPEDFTELAETFDVMAESFQLLR